MDKIFELKAISNKVIFLGLKEELFIKDKYYLNSYFDKVLKNIICSCESKD